MARSPCALMLVCLSVVTPWTARATSFVPMTIADLTRGSAAVVVGTIGTVRSVQARDGRLFTLVDVAVEQVLAGQVPATQITLKEDGGAVGGRREVVFGAPQFDTGHPVLLFLSVRRDGSFRVNQLALGKFDLELDANGMPRTVQRFARATMLDARHPASGASLNAMRRAVQRVAQRLPRSRVTRKPLAAPPEANDPALPQSIGTAFTLLGPGRFFEPDQGIPLSFLVDQSGDAILGLTAARQAVDDAMNAWTNVPTATITLQDSGLTGDVTAPCPGPNIVRFDDPDGEIDPPVNCSGTLAVGGFCSDSAESKIFSNTAFERALRAKLTFANGWQGCAVWTQCNFAEIATHELGHAIGLGHSSENPAEPDPTLRDATMYFEPHFDGRCAAVRSDDVDGVSFIYPKAIPPTITTSDPLPDGTVSVPYSVTLTATGGTGSYTWTMAGDQFPGLQLSANGVLSGTPTATTSAFSFLIEATDSQGNSHTKRLHITVHAAGTVTATPLPTATPSQPAACVGDCDGNGAVTVNELLIGVNIALGSAPVGRCPSFDANHDGAATINEILTAVNNVLDGCPA